MLHDEVSRRVFAPTEALLRLLLQDGDGLGELHFFAGETHRLRASRGDLALALDEYRQALEHDDAPVETHRSRGLVALRTGDRATARACLARYLELAPTAEDREVIAEQLAELGDAK
jgi:regulator of sirC expression with transglutaminase-like and TPR domain